MTKKLVKKLKQSIKKHNLQEDAQQISAMIKDIAHTFGHFEQFCIELSNLFSFKENYSEEYISRNLLQFLDEIESSIDYELDGDPYALKQCHSLFSTTMMILETCIKPYVWQEARTKVKPKGNAGTALLKHLLESEYPNTKVVFR